MAGPASPEGISGPRGPRVAPAVLDHLTERGEVCVIVKLRDTSAPVDSRLLRRRKHREAQNGVLSRLPKDAYRIRYQYRGSPVLVLSTRSSEVIRTIERSPGVESIETDIRGTGALDEARALVRADEVFDMGLRGEGRVVAVLDSGVDMTHPDLGEAVIHEKRFLNQGLTVGDSAMDGHGHGTHVTGIIASRGRVAPRGVAPGALIVAVKVLDDSNTGWVSDWAAGVEHVIDLHEEDNGIRVDAINMSVVTLTQYREICDSASAALSGATRDAMELGISIFAASGNSGSLTRMSMPACLESVVSVGSVDPMGVHVSTFTSRNSLLDILAPGEAISSANLDGGFSSRTGTSQASPFVTASALLLREIEPLVPPGLLLETLLHDAVPVYDPLVEEIFPRLDVLGAVMTLKSPRIADLSCRYDAVGGTLEARWTPVVDTDVVEVEVLEDGVTRRKEILPGYAETYAYPGAIEGATYEMCFNTARSGFSSVPSCCTVLAVPVEPGFIRGDCDGDNAVNITDATTALGLLFLGARPVPPCLVACDANDDESLDISDPVYTLNALFRGHALPPAPFPGCGTDPTPGGISCVSPTCEG